MMMSFRSRRRGVAATLVLSWAISAAGTGGAGAAVFPLLADAQGTPPPSSGARTPPGASTGAPNTPVQEGLASIRGVLYREDELTRVKGSMVTAINTQTGRRYLSNYTGDNGAYEVKDLPAGTYDIAIEASGRMYVTESLVDLAEKQRLYMSFSLQPKEEAPGAAAATGPGFEAGPAAGAGAGAPRETGTAAESGTAKVTYSDPNAIPAPQEPSKKKSFWHSAGGIAIITVLVGGAFGAAVASQHH